MKWDYWIGADNEPIMLVKRLVDIRGWRIELHKIVKADPPDCFHTHLYNAWRLVLWGGYIEEVEPSDIAYVYRMCAVGHIGRVTYDYSHRIADLIAGVSYSLWFHGPAIHEVETRGRGWATAKEVSYHEGDPT